MMWIFFSITTILLISGISFREKCDFDSALEIRQANVIKGFFILLVFLSHIQPYISQSGYVFKGLDKIFLPFFNIALGQNIVCMFLFYSGYGIQRQIQKKGEEYVRTIPKHRLLNTLLNFDIAVLAFLILAIVLKTQLSPAKIVLAFTGWDSIGNSNWYIFDIIILYGLTYLSQTFARKPQSQWIVFSILALAFTIFMYCVKQIWWWDTILCYWAGVTIAFFHDRIFGLLEQHWKRWLAVCLVAFCISFVCISSIILLGNKGYATWWMMPWFWANLEHVAFALCIVILTMRFDFKNTCLEWCGRLLFPIYIYQRLPMMIIPQNTIASYPAIYIVFSLAVTLCIA